MALYIADWKVKGYMSMIQVQQSCKERPVLEVATSFFTLIWETSISSPTQLKQKLVAMTARIPSFGRAQALDATHFNRISFPISIAGFLTDLSLQ